MRLWGWIEARPLGSARAAAEIYYQTLACKFHFFLFPIYPDILYRGFMSAIRLKGGIMTTSSEIVRAAIPGASEAVCERVLWGMTPFPVGRVFPKQIFRAASRLRRAEASGIRLCDFCDQRAVPDEWVCEKCGAALEHAR